MNKFQINIHNNGLPEFIDFVKRYFPYVKKLISMINFLHDHLGFDDGIIQRLYTFKNAVIKGKLYFGEFGQSFEIHRSICTIKEYENEKFAFKINRVLHVNWFRRKINQFREVIITSKSRQNRGIQL